MVDCSYVYFPNVNPRCLDPIGSDRIYKLSYRDYYNEDWRNFHVYQCCLHVYHSNDVFSHVLLFFESKIPWLKWCKIRWKSKIKSFEWSTKIIQQDRWSGNDVEIDARWETREWLLGFKTWLADFWSHWHFRTANP